MLVLCRPPGLRKGLGLRVVWDQHLLLQGVVFMSFCLSCSQVCSSLVPTLLRGELRPPNVTSFEVGLENWQSAVRSNRLVRDVMSSAIVPTMRTQGSRWLLRRVRQILVSSTLCGLCWVSAVF